MDDVSSGNRADVRDFLVTRRARITPQQAGLTFYGGNRRVPGLRREEVALLAGVSADYYTRLEQGNLTGVSDTVLEAIAGALQLNEAERLHLLDLARAASTSPARAALVGALSGPSDLGRDSNHRDLSPTGRSAAARRRGELRLGWPISAWDDAATVPAPNARCWYLRRCGRSRGFRPGRAPGRSGPFPRTRTAISLPWAPR